MKPCDEAGPVGRRSDGYVRLTVNGRRVLAHRQAWTDHHGPIPDGIDVLHHCDNRACREITHLYLGDDADNVRDREERGRGVRITGHAHHAAKLTQSDADAMRDAYALGGVTQRELANRYGVTQRAVVKVLHGITWSPPTHNAAIGELIDVVTAQRAKECR